jgi:polysaccharide chain length determinant protein (PEP-CTERM system associated)
MGALLVIVRRQLLSAWRYRWAAVLVSWVVCAGGWAAVYAIPNQYEASARLYVDADAVLTPLLRGIALDSSLSSQLDVLQRTLLSRPNLEKLISNTDLDLSIAGTGDLQAMVARLANDIKITPQTRNLFSISYRNTSPKLAFDVVQTILTTFIESKTGSNRSEMQNAQLFLQQQISQYEQQLRATERKRAEFRSKYLDLLPMGDTGASRLDQARATLRQLQGQLADETAKRDLLAKELASTPQLLVTETGGGPTGGGGAYRDPRVEEAQRFLDELRLRYTDNHPDVIAAKKRLEALKAEAARAPGPTPQGGKPGDGKTAGTPTRSLPNPVYEQLKVRLTDSESQISSLQRQIADATHERDRLEEMARSAPGVQAEYINLNRDYDVLRKNYDELLQRREQMRIASSAEADADKIKIQVIDPPQVPQNPVAPKRVLLTSVVLAAGLAAGLAFAILLVQFDQSFHSIDELRDLGLPVAGGISLLNATVTRSALAAVTMFSLSLVLLGIVYGGLVYRLAKVTGGL